MGPILVEVHVGATPQRPAGAAAESFDAWVAGAGPGLTRFARLVTGNPVDAADAVQEALVAVLLRWRRLSADGGQDAYARRVVVNHRISWWRRIGRREQLIDTADAPEAPHVWRDPDGADAAVARRLLDGLPPRQRAAVVLRYYDDLPFADIAELLGCPEGTARSHVHRALQRLRELLEEDDHDRG